jgi:hypothetical protein
MSPDQVGHLDLGRSPAPGNATLPQLMERVCARGTEAASAPATPGDLDCGVAEANALVAGYLFANAKGGNVGAQIFWLKTRAHWRERAVPDNLAPGSDAEPSPPVVLLLPDNSGDPELTQALRDTQVKHSPGRPRR